MLKDARKGKGKGIGVNRWRNLVVNNEIME